MTLNFLGQLPYLFCCVLNYGDCGSNQMSQNVYVEEENIVCSCIQNDGVQYIGKIETISAGYASLCLRESALPIERIDSYLMRIADGGLRNPFGKTQDDAPKVPSTGSSPGDAGGPGTLSPQLVAVPDEPPLTRWPVQAYVVKGVLVAGRRNAVAIVVPPEEISDSSSDESVGAEEGFAMDEASVQDFAEQYVVKIGERLGSNGGIISSIGLKGLTILEGKNKLVVPLNR